jgi:hypothetical protein
MFETTNQWPNDLNLSLLLAQPEPVWPHGLWECWPLHSTFMATNVGMLCTRGVYLRHQLPNVQWWKYDLKRSVSKRNHEKQIAKYCKDPVLTRIFHLVKDFVLHTKAKSLQTSCESGCASEDLDVDLLFPERSLRARDILSASYWPPGTASSHPPCPPFARRGGSSWIIPLRNHFARGEKIPGSQVSNSWLIPFITELSLF